MMMTSLEVALFELQRRTAAGEEFPDACGSVARRFKVGHDALRDAYDEADSTRPDLASQGDRWPFPSGNFAQGE